MVNLLRKLKLSQRFALLVALFALGFTVYGAWSFKTLDELKVNGPIYQRIVQGKDLIADILPPPEYIIESYLVSLQLAEAADKAEQDTLVARLRKLRGEYDERHRFWLNEPLEKELADTFLKDAHGHAMAFYATAFDELIPALQKRERAGAGAALSRMKSAYEAHRKHIDAVVEMAAKRNAADEAGAVERIAAASRTLMAILLISMLGGVGLVALIIRDLLASLGGEPEYAVEIAHAIAGRDLTVKVETRPGDTTSLLAAMKVMQSSLAQIIGKVNHSVIRLAQSAEQLAETAGAVAQQTTQQQDAGHSMAAAVEQMSSSVAEITSTMEELSASSSQIADHSRSVADVANQTWESSMKGSQAMQSLLARMGDIRNDNQASLQEIVELGGKSREISKVMGIINTVADQTKLIAFNAALEASSAGEAGKRFSVVAQEIRRLADSVTDSTGEIEVRVQEIQDSISRLVISSEKGAQTIGAGMTASQGTALSLNELVDAAGHTRTAAQQISLSTQQQKTASGQVVLALREIVSASSHTAQSIRSITDISGEMSHMAGVLNELVRQFRLSEQAQPASA